MDLRVSSLPKVPETWHKLLAVFPHSCVNCFPSSPQHNPCRALGSHSIIPGLCSLTYLRAESRANLGRLVGSCFSGTFQWAYDVVSIPHMYTAMEEPANVNVLKGAIVSHSMAIARDSLVVMGCGWFADGGRPDCGATRYLTY